MSIFPADTVVEIHEMTGNREEIAVVLLSGGMDSSTCLAVAASEGYSCHTLAFDYGQRHRIELEMARRQATAFAAREHRVLRVDLADLGGSALTGASEVPSNGQDHGVPPTYVPARNTVFLSLGLAWAEVLAAGSVFIGANQVDFSGYPDCRRPFLEAYERMANLATRRAVEGHPVRIRAPLLDMSKSRIIQLGTELGVDFARTHTCYDPAPGGLACGRCPACRLRLKGFAEAGFEDPLPYADRS
jgi:7-cyano-7-deazaguanine synthase